MLLLHGRPDANGGRLLVLHHVCEACGTQPKGAESKEREREIYIERDKERERKGRGGYEERRFPNQITSHTMDAATGQPVAIH